MLYRKQTEIVTQIFIIQELIRATSSAIHLLYDVIDCARVGRLSSYLVKPFDLLELLEPVRAQLPVGDSLPVTLNTNRDTIYQYYVLAKISAYFYENELRIVITVPLIHIARKFHIYKVMQATEASSS